MNISKSETFSFDHEEAAALSEHQRERITALQNEAEVNFEILKNAAQVIDEVELQSLGPLFRRANTQYEAFLELVAKCLSEQEGVSFNDVLIQIEVFLETVRAVKVELDKLGYEVELSEAIVTEVSADNYTSDTVSGHESVTAEDAETAQDGGADEAGFRSEYYDGDRFAPAGSEILDSELLNEPIPKPRYVPVDTETKPRLSLSELYPRWQVGDVSLFRKGWWHEFDAIARDVSVLLKAAGYDEAFVDNFGKESLKPWMDRVNIKRRDGDESIRWGQLRDEILHKVQDLLNSREPDMAILASENESVSPAPEVATELPETETQPDQIETAPNVDKELEQVQFEFLTLKEKIVGLPELAIWRELGDRILSALSTLSERDEAVAMRLKQKYLKTLIELNLRLQKYLSERSSGEVVTIDAGGNLDSDVPVNLPVQNPENVLTAVDIPVVDLNSNTREASKPSEVPILTEVVEMQGYQEANHERAVAREEFVSARDTYYAALHDHYRNLGVRARELVGAKVMLPPELEKLKQAHDDTQRVYAVMLDAALQARSERGLSKNEYHSLKDDKTRELFAKRFVVRSGEELEAVKQEVGDTPEFVKRAQALAKFARDHKWLVRSVTVLGYMGVGALTGGATAAFAAGSRTVAGMVGGMAGGAAGGVLGRKMYAAEVAETTEAREAAATEAKEEFSFANFQAKRDVYQGTVKAANRAKTKQTAAAMTGAIVGGMAAGRIAAEAVSDAWNALATDPLIEMKAVAVPRFAPNGEPLPALSVEGVTLRGAHVTDLATGDLEVTDVVIPKVMSEIRLHIKDLLEAHPNMNQGKLEEEVFARLEAKYSGQEWWQKAEIKSLDIGTIKLEEVTGNVSLSPEEPITVPPAPPEPISIKPASVESSAIIEHTVQQGETLTSIMKKEYADVLEKLAPAERDRVLAELFERTRTDAVLRDSIGLRTGEVDKIYTGQDLQLDKLGAELKTLVESEPVRPRTGALSVAMEGGVEDVPIKFGSTTSPITETTIDMGGDTEATPADFDTREVERVAEAVPAKPRFDVYNPPRPGVGFVTSGNYFDSPQYRDFLAENGMSRELVLDATKKFALEFEGKTYGWLNELLQSFDSPYDELGTMTLKELDDLKLQAGESESALRTLLSEQAAREAAERGVAVGEVSKTFNLPTVRAWDALIDAMRRTEGFAYNENTPIKDMIHRYVAEQMIKNNYDVRFKAGIK